MGRIKKIKEKLKKFMRKIKLFIIRSFISLRKLFRKKKLRVYRVIGSNTKTMVGTVFVGVPKRGKETPLLTRKRGYLTIVPITVTVHAKGDRLVVYGKYSRITARRIR